MRNLLKIPCLVAIATTVGLSSCNSVTGVFSSPSYLAVTISPRPAFVPAGGSVMLTGTASNNLGVPQWGFLNATDTANVGTLTPVAGSPNSVLYTAPSTPPIYNNAAPAGIQQGVVTVTATLNPPAQSTLPVAQDSISIFITTGTVTISPITPATVTLAAGATQVFSGYELGSDVNTFTWQVNNVTGGSATTGTIDFKGLYTAPATVPMTGSTVMVTMISNANPSLSATAVVTLTP
jgi:hypothetical protein